MTGLMQWNLTGPQVVLAPGVSIERSECLIRAFWWVRGSFLDIPIPLFEVVQKMISAYSLPRRWDSRVPRPWLHFPSTAQSWDDRLEIAAIIAQFIQQMIDFPSKS
jgi:hypothetical protein